jgi:hypothetical protein
VIGNHLDLMIGLRLGADEDHDVVNMSLPVIVIERMLWCHIICCVTLWELGRRSPKLYFDMFMWRTA